MADAPKFPVWNTTMDILDLCWQHRPALVHFGAIPTALAVALGVVAKAVGVEETKLSPELAVLAFLQLLIFLPAAVTWYRYVVNGEEAARTRPVFTLGRSEVRMLMWQILLLLVVFAIAVAGSAVIGGIAGIFTAIAGQPAGATVAALLAIPFALGLMVAVNRLAMVLALSALDQPVSFKLAWRVTEGLGWRLLGAFVLIVLAAILAIALGQLAFFVIGAVIGMIAGTELKEILAYGQIILDSLIVAFTTFATTTLFGFVYRMRQGVLATILAGTPPASPAAPPEP